MHPQHPQQPYPPRPMGSFQPQQPPRGGPGFAPGGFAPPQQQQQQQPNNGFAPPPPRPAFQQQQPQMNGGAFPPQQQQHFQQQPQPPRPMQPGFAGAPPPPPRGGFSPQTPQPQQLQPPRGVGGFLPPPPQGGGIFYGTAPSGGPPPPPMQQQQRHAPGFTPVQQPRMGQAGSSSPSVSSRGITHLNLDAQHQCPPQYCRFTFDKFPESEQVRARAGNLPLAAVFRPFCDFADAPQVPAVNFQASTGVVRCRRCRAYVSPFSVFVDNGRRWQCALCFNVNECEAEYYCELNPETGKRLDYLSRPELSSGCIDIIAPEEYSLRPPPPPVFLFVIDVSAGAVRNGMLAVVSQAIKRVLPALPGLPRTQVGFITFDAQDVHFYDLSSSNSGGTFRMLVVSELNQMFHPTATDNLLAEVDGREDYIGSFLDQLPGMHAAAGAAPGALDPTASALGPAIEAAFDIMAPMGGKMVVFQTLLPMVVDNPPGDSSSNGNGPPNQHGGIAKPGRGFDGKTLGGPNEHDTLQPAHTWYSSKADIFNRQHISLDWYCAPSHNTHYVDVSTTAELCHLTAGKLRLYSKFHAFRDGERMTRDIERSLTSVCCTEAVMRVRASTGVRVNKFYGSFTMRARDLIALPQSDADGVYGFEFQFENADEILPGRYVVFQSAVLYTTTQGERRILVTNTAVPISQNPQEVVNCMQPDVVSTVMFKRAMEEAKEAGVGLEQARNRLKLAFWKLQEAGLAPPLTDMLARCVVGCIKSPALRGGTDVGFDERYYLLRLVGRASIGRLQTMMRPKLVQLGAGGGGGDGGGSLPLTRQSLHPEGVYLLDNGLQLLLWMGSRVPASTLLAVVGVDQLAKIDASVRVLPPAASTQQQHPVKQQLDAAVAQSRRAFPEDFAPVLIVREGDAIMESRLFWGLINDPQSFRGGEITAEELVHKGRAPHGGAPPGPGGARPPPQQQQQQQPQQPPRGMMPPPQGMAAAPPAPRGGPPGTPTMQPRGPMMPPAPGGVMGGGPPRAASPGGPMMPRGPMMAQGGPRPPSPMQAPRGMPSGGPQAAPRGPPMTPGGGMMAPPPPRPMMGGPPSTPGGGPRGPPPPQQQQQQPAPQGLLAPRGPPPPPQQQGLAPRGPPSQGAAPPPRGPPPPQQGLTPRGPAPPPQGLTPRGPGGPPPQQQQGMGPPPRGPPPPQGMAPLPRGPPPPQGVGLPRGPPPPQGMAPRGPPQPNF